MSRLLVYLVTVIFCVTKTFAQSEPFYFIQLSDPQFGMLEKNKSGTVANIRGLFL